MNKEIRTNENRLTSESADMVKLMKEANAEIKSSNPDENAYQKLFWEQQMQYNAGSDK